MAPALIPPSCRTIFESLWPSSTVLHIYGHAYIGRDICIYIYVYIFHAVYTDFKSQDGLFLVLHISFIPQIFVGVDTVCSVKIMCYFSHLRLLVHSSVGVLVPQDQCEVVTLEVSNCL
jgi:hypothetical protein